MSGDIRTRVLDATFAEVDDNGLAGLTVEAVAARAESSRATIYRHFPGGRDELVETTLRREVGRFLEALMADARPGASMVDDVAALVTGANRLVREHRVFQRLLAEEAEAIAPPLATVYPMLHDALVSHLAGLLASDADASGPAADTAAVVDPNGEGPTMKPAIEDPAVEDTADHGARMILSYVGTTGSWDLDDPVAVQELVRRRILPGVVIGRVGGAGE